MADWTAMMHARLRELKIGGRLVFMSAAELALDGAMISELTIEEGAEEALLPGDVLSASCTLDLVNDAGQWLPGGSLLGNRELIGATLMPRLGAVENGEILWRDLGVFQIESAVFLENEGRLRIRGFDSAAYELGGAFTDVLNYPVSLETLWRHAIAQTRYNWSGRVPNGSAVIDAKPDWKDGSVRTALGWIAAAAGCFVRIGRDGSLELRPLNGGQEYWIGPEAYLKLEKDSAAFGPVDALRVAPVGENAGEKLYRGAANTNIHVLSVSGNPLFVQDAPGMDALARGMLAEVEGLGSMSLRLDWRGDPELKIGDKLLLTDTHGVISSGVLSRQTMKYALGFSASSVCAIPENSSSGVRRAITPEGGLNASALVGTVDGGLLSAGSVTTDKLAAGSVTAEKLEASIIDAVSLDAISAKIESLTAKDIETDRLAAALASFTVLTAGTADFDRAAVQHLVANAMNLDFGVGDTVFISNLRASYAQIVNAAIGNLCIKASDGNYYTIDVDSEGNVSAARTSVSAGEAAAGQTNAGRVILGTDVTAESLNTSSLLATYALVNKIDAARIDVDQLFAREAFISKLATSQIVAGKSLTIIAGDAAAAKESASSAQSAANSAQNTANSAQSAASTAQSTANSAQSAANSAQSAASSAQSTANAAQNTASSAQSAASAAVSAASSAQNTASAAQNTANAGSELAQQAAQSANDAKDKADAAANAWKDAVTRPEFERVVRIDAGGMHVGDNLTACEVLIDSGTVNVVVGGHSYSTFGSGYLQLGGDVRIRRPKTGGVAFSPIKR